MAREEPSVGRTVHPLFIPFMTVLTLGIYWFVWLYRRYAEIRQANPDATKVPPGRAVGFLFIPFFNFYWTCYIAYDFARAAARVQKARFGRALVWPYAVTILFIGGSVFSAIVQMGVVAWIVSYFRRDPTMVTAVGAALGMICKLPTWSGMIIAQMSLNRVWSEPAAVGGVSAELEPSTSLKSYRRRFVALIACLVLLLATLPPLMFNLVSLKRVPATAARLGVAWTQQSTAQAPNHDASAVIAVLRARLDRLTGTDFSELLVPQLAEMAIPESPVVQPSSKPGEIAEVLLSPSWRTGRKLEALYHILTTENALELKEVVAGPYVSQDELKAAFPQGIGEQAEVLKQAGAEQYFLCQKKPVLTGQTVAEAKVAAKPDGGRAIEVRLTEQGGQTMRGYSETHYGKMLAIVVDGKLMSTPVINGVFSQYLQIDGGFSTEEIFDLTSSLRAGAVALPSPIRLVDGGDVPYPYFAQRRAWRSGSLVLLFGLALGIFVWAGRSRVAFTPGIK